MISSGDLVGTNLFAYCGNNPANNDDPDGRSFIKNAIKWVSKNVIKPVAISIKKALSTINCTYSRGINVSATPGAFSFNAQVGISIDAKGNVALQGNFSGGVTGGSPSISATAYQSVSNSHSIDDLYGYSYQVGGTANIPIGGVPMSFGGDFCLIPKATSSEAPYCGVTVNVGLGTPGAEFHTEWGTTTTFNETRFNIFDTARNAYMRIMEW